MSEREGQKIWSARYWATDRAKEVRAAYLQSEAGKASRQRYLRSPKNIAAQALRTRSWRERHPEKWEAHKAVKRALASGALIKPFACTDCERDDARIEAHHEDYALPLEVTWVCRRCHYARHGRV